MSKEWGRVFGGKERNSVVLEGGGHYCKDSSTWQDSPCTDAGQKAWSDASVSHLKLKEFLHNLSCDRWSRQQGKGTNLSEGPSASASVCSCDSSGVLWVPRWQEQQGQLTCPHQVCRGQLSGIRHLHPWLILKIRVEKRRQGGSDTSSSSDRQTQGHGENSSRQTQDCETVCRNTFWV